MSTKISSPDMSTRMSINHTVGRQTPKTDFGTRMKVGLDTAAGAVGGGLQVAAGMVPGGAILSAAVSSVGTMSNGSSSGQSMGGSALGATYAGAQPLQMGGSHAQAPISSNVVNTTVGGGGGGRAGGNGMEGLQLEGPGQVNSPGVPVPPGGSSAINEMQQMQSQLLNTQIQMQRENQVFSTISNVLKTRHDTVKNTIANVR